MGSANIHILRLERHAVFVRNGGNTGIGWETTVSEQFVNEIDY